MVIHWEKWKKCKFDHTSKWYRPNAESIQKNETHKLLWDFEIQTDHLISARRLDLIIISTKERTCRIVDHRVKLKGSEKRDEYLKLDGKLKKKTKKNKLWNMKMTIIPIVTGALVLVS